MLTVIIPSKTEKFLKQTIEDVLTNATGEIEILPVLDGYTAPDDELVQDPRVRYLSMPPSNNTQKRHGINLAVSQAKGEYIMSLDAHCLVAKGFDTQLIKDHQPNWVQIPRRHRLDAEKWDLQVQSDSRPPIDYEYIMFRPLIKDRSIHGFKWDERTRKRWDIPIDDTIEFQGSCWFMTKDWFNKNGFMQTEGFTGWGQEAESIGFKTWLRGGEVKTNKNTYYAHLHKGTKYGRMYWMSRAECRKSYAYSYDYFFNNRDEMAIYDFGWLIDRFMPMPGWPLDWRIKLGYKK